MQVTAVVSDSETVTAKGQRAYSRHGTPSVTPAYIEDCICSDSVLSVDQYLIYNESVASGFRCLTVP